MSSPPPQSDGGEGVLSVLIYRPRSVVIAIVLWMSSVAPLPAQSEFDKISTRAIEEVSAKGVATLIVGLRGPQSLASTDIGQRRSVVSLIQKQVLGELEQAGLKVLHRFETIPYPVVEGD